MVILDELVSYMNWKAFYHREGGFPPNDISIKTERWEDCTGFSIEDFGQWVPENCERSYYYICEYYNRKFHY